MWGQREPSEWAVGNWRLLNSQHCIVPERYQALPTKKRKHHTIGYFMNLGYWISTMDFFVFFILAEVGDHFRQFSANQASSFVLVGEADGYRPCQGHAPYLPSPHGAGVRLVLGPYVP